MTTVALPKVSLDSTFTVGRKSYTTASAVSHAVACYDKLFLLQEDTLPLFRDIGNIIIQIKCLFGDNKKAYGKFIATTELNNEAVSSADKYDSEWIATHWTLVQQMNKAGKLSSLGVSSIRKIVLEAHPELRKKPKVSKGAGNTSKGKGKPKASEVSKDTTVESVSPFKVVEAKNEAELAKQVYDALESKGFKRAEFAKELAKLFK